MQKEEQKYYRTIITVEILSDFPYDYGFDLSNVAYDMTYGDVSGGISQKCDEITKEEMKKALISQGSDPSFIFGESDENSNY